MFCDFSIGPVSYTHLDVYKRQGWNRYLSLDTLREHGAAFQTLADEHYILTRLALMLVFALLTASVVPGVVFITVTAGYLFGPWVGGVGTAFAATVGALAIYYVGRTALGESLRLSLIHI